MLSSCVEDVELQVTDADSRIFFYSEIEAFEHFSFNFKTVEGFNDDYEKLYPQEISEIDLELVEDTKKCELDFRFNSVENCFESEANTQKAKSGVFYKMESHLVNRPEFPDVYATTFVPPAFPLEFLGIVDYETQGVEQGLVLDLTFRCAVDIEHDFYEIKAFFKDKSTDVTVDYPIDIELIGNLAGVDHIQHRNSVMVDGNYNIGQYITGKISGYVPERIIANSDHVYFKISAINPEMYQYHIVHQKRLLAEKAEIAEPVIIYTNVNNGLGLFTGYTSTFDSIKIK